MIDKYIIRKFRVYLSFDKILNKLDHTKTCVVYKKRIEERKHQVSESHKRRNENGAYLDGGQWRRSLQEAPQCMSLQLRNALEHGSATNTANKEEQQRHREREGSVG